MLWFPAAIEVEFLLPQTMSDSLMYRLTYYNYADASTLMTGQRGYDRVRQVKIGLMDFKSAPHLPLSSFACM